MKITHTLFAGLALLASLGTQAQNCGPGTSDPQCNAHNAAREAAIRQQQQDRVNAHAKRDGTFGATGQRPDSKPDSSNVNNSGRGGAISK